MEVESLGTFWEIGLGGAGRAVVGQGAVAHVARGIAVLTVILVPVVEFLWPVFAVAGEAALGFGIFDVIWPETYIYVTVHLANVSVG
jgi:hypothetical protein